ncbi:hypothetical protein [Mycobacterium florentinum]|uniref:hypothetical protein n=1 Tax=Mycobacterium florentinum TaxID=292462 RepID=UPI00138CCC37|nr:hypothetical protein [Mycobacterium florentinum]BBX76219.1 hypothetical protein MFLOJ_00060 [Mycobacterium florentinum]
MALSEYEQEQLTKVNAYKHPPRRPERRLLPFTVGGLGSGVVNTLLKLPVLREVKKPGAAVLDTAAAGAARFMTKTGQLATSEARVIGAYAKKGHPVEHLDDIRKLDLRSIDEVASFGLRHRAYSASAAAEGAAARPSAAVRRRQPPVRRPPRAPRRGRDWAPSPRRWASTPRC